MRVIQGVAILSARRRRHDFFGSVGAAGNASITMNSVAVESPSPGCGNLRTRSHHGGSGACDEPSRRMAMASASTLLVLSGPAVMWGMNTRDSPICAMASAARPRGMPGARAQDVGDPERDDGGTATTSSIACTFGQPLNGGCGGHFALSAPLFDADRSGPEGGDL